MDKKEIFNVQLTGDKAQEIDLVEIDPEIISCIREINADSSGYTQLRTSIEKDGQKQPIIIRRLTDEEKEKTQGKAYGIIDGHHRFIIAQELKCRNILAIIDNGATSQLRDMILAMRFNEASIKMSSIQKGQVIYEILNLIDEKSSNKEIIEKIGSEIFGLKKAMAYRCVQSYKQATGIKSIEKPRKNKFDDKKLKSLVKELNTNTKNFSNEDCVTQLSKIKEIESQLRFFKKAIQEKQKNIKS